MQLTLEQARSGHLFIIKGYRWYRDIQVSSRHLLKFLKNIQAYTDAIRNQSDVQVKLNSLTVRPQHSPEIPIFKASFSR